MKLPLCRVQNGGLIFIDKYKTKGDTCDIGGIYNHNACNISTN